MTSLGLSLVTSTQSHLPHKIAKVQVPGIRMWLSLWGGIFVPTQASSVNFGGPSDLQPQTTEADLPILSQMLLAGADPGVGEAERGSAMRVTRETVPETDAPTCGAEGALGAP